MRIILLVCSLILGTSLGQASTITTQCFLSSAVATVSPLKENLNYSQGSGMASDISVATGEDASARVGNINFKRSAGDTISETMLSNPTGCSKLVVFQKKDSSITYKLFIGQKMSAAGKYGSAPLTQASASLKYQVAGSSQSIYMASFFCN